MNILVTGGCGFIGSHFTKYLLNKGYTVFNVDCLTYAGRLENLEDISNNENYHHFNLSITDTDLMNYLFGNIYRNFGGIDAIVHLAAESHVDNSINNPNIFVDTNVLGTLTLLNLAKEYNIKFVHVSTDEVYGTLGSEGLFTEDSPIAPNSPYSASKASSDLLVRSYFETYKLDTVITRCSNNYGPNQFPEKLIPLAISNLMDGKRIPIYGNGMNIRDWLYVEDHCYGIYLAMMKGISGQVYNIGGFNEWTNIDIARKIISVMELPEPYENYFEYVEDRKGHDFRYAIDSTKITNDLGWKPKYNFESGIANTVKWYINNEDWWRTIKKEA